MVRKVTGTLLPRITTHLAIVRLSRRDGIIETGQSPKTGSPKIGGRCNSTERYNLCYEGLGRHDILELQDVGAQQGCESATTCRWANQGPAANFTVDLLLKSKFWNSFGSIHER